MEIRPTDSYELSKHDYKEVSPDSDIYVAMVNNTCRTLIIDGNEQGLLIIKDNG